MTRHLSLPKRSPPLLLLLLMAASLATVTPAPPAGDFTTSCPSQCTCSWVKGKKKAVCTGRAVAGLPRGLSADIQVLDLTGARIVELEEDALQRRGLQHLQRLHLRGVGLRRLDKHAFRGLSLLVELDLSENALTKVGPETFADNGKLRSLSLAGNPLQALGELQFPDLPHIQRLNLSNCQLASISPRAFKRLSNLSELLLNGNKLAILESDIFQSLTKLNSLTLHDNPWRCDCHLRLFRDWLIEHNLYQAGTYCVEPERLIGKPWSAATSEQFACRPQIYIPEPTVVVDNGKNATLRCQISGNPAANTNWVRGGRIISNNSQIINPNNTGQTYIIHEEGNVNRWTNLTVTRVTEQDTGQYLCVGTNAGGVVERNVTVVFRSMVAPPAKPSSALLSRPLLIGCVAGGGGLLLLLLLLVLYCCCCRRQGRSRAKEPSSSGAESIMVINQKPTRMGDYEKLPQTDVEMERLRGTATVRFAEPSGSVMCNVGPPDDVLAASAPRRRSLPDSSAAADDGHKDYPDLLHLPRRGGTSHDSPAEQRGLAATLVGPAAMVPRQRHSLATMRPRPGYLTLPRRPRTPSWGASPAYDPVYDKLGPRTTADGSSRLSLTPSAEDTTVNLPAFYLPVEASVPDPAVFNSLPRNSRSQGLSIPSLDSRHHHRAGGRGRSLSTDLIEPLSEVPEELEETPAPPPPPQFNGEPLVKEAPRPPPKPKKVTPPVLPKPQRNGASGGVAMSYQDETQDGTEV